MEMSHEDVPYGEARAVTHHLALCPRATVEEERVSLSLKGDRTHIAAHRRERRGGAKECDSNHAPSRCWDEYAEKIASSFPGQKSRSWTRNVRPGCGSPH